VGIVSRTYYQSLVLLHTYPSIFVGICSRVAGNIQKGETNNLLKQGLSPLLNYKYLKIYTYH
jgi:hypothetical protein